MSMLLSTLLQRLDYRLIVGKMDIRISSVEFDSRRIVENSLFVAITGFNSDGHEYIPNAINSGAKCVVVDASRDKYDEEELINLHAETGVTFIEMTPTSKAIAQISASFFDHPEDRLDLVGVTGTKGKTTITFMIHEILQASGRLNGLIGTVCNMIGEEKRKASHTTPESRYTYELLDEISRKNFDSCVMEVSSQGLKMDRVEGLRFDVGCFTNLSEDHIGKNEHPDMDDYLNCKLKLFDSSRIAVVNKDCDVADTVINYASARCPVYTFGLSDKSDCYAYDIVKDRRDSVTGTKFMLESPWYSGEVFVALPGVFNVYNALCAICVAGVLKIDFDSVKNALSVIKVPGRVQPVANKSDISILVDYAHNGVGLENVLSTIREYTTGRLISVFGCGGDRSNTRRFEMGEISGNLADYTIITSDNPRTEDPMKIIDDIVTGMSKTEGKYEIIADRAEAIKTAIHMAKPGDSVIIAGKGHEDYQIFADKTIHFDDREVASAVVSEMEAGNA